MKQKNIVWEYSEMLIVAIVLALIIRSFVVQPFRIPSGSMMNTLLNGDYLLVTRFNYAIKIPFVDKEILRTGEPGHGDVIVFKYPKDVSQDYIKRVVGLPGDTIEIRNKQLFRNGRLVKEPYVRHSSPWSRDAEAGMAPITVPEDKYFVLGDNRDDSADSRVWGFVPRDNIHGKAWIIYWSWGSWSDIRWSRIGTLLYPDEAAAGR